MQHCYREVLECFFRGEDGIDESFVEDHLASCARCYRLAAEVVGTLERRRGGTGKLSPSAAAFRYILDIEDTRARAEVRAKGLISRDASSTSAVLRRMYSGAPSSGPLSLIAR